MRSKLQRPKVRVCPAVVCAAAALMAALILMLPLGPHRFEGKISQWAGAAADKAEPVAQGSHFNPAASPNPESQIPNPGYGAAADKAEPAVRARAVESYGKLPLSFEINKGQTDSRVKFLSRGSGYSLFLTGNEAVLSLRQSNSNGKRQMAKGKNEFQRSPFDGPRSLLQRPASFQFPVSNFQTPATNNEPRTTDALLRMKLVGANPNPQIVGMDELPGKSNYFIGNDPKKWRTNVPSYTKVKYANVYPGVDLVYYGNQGKLEYDFVVQPGADPRQIALDVGAGLALPKRAPQAAPLHVNATGDLVVGTDGAEVVFHKPVVYQLATYNELRTTNGGGRDSVEGQYVLRGDNRIAFRLSDYDRRRPVVIDPVLAYSTYLGGSDYEQAGGIAVDASGNAYVVGETGSTDFPTTAGAFQTTFAGGDFEFDAFVSRLNAAGSALVYSTYLGGSHTDYGFGIAVDAAGSAYVTGSTQSPDFPVTPGAFQTIYAGGNGGSCTCGDAFVSKLNAAGSALVYSTFLGGSADDGGSGIAVDASGDAYITGGTSSANFPTTAGAFQTISGGGSCGSVPCSDAFVSKLNAAGSALAYSTYLGGSGADASSGIAVDASGNAFVTGFTGSSDFPVTPSAFQIAYGGGVSDAFVSKLNAAGSALVYSTYVGGGSEDGGGAIAVDRSGNAYVVGSTPSSNFPTTPGAFQTTYGGGGSSDAFISKLNDAGSALVYSTYLGGSSADVGIAIVVDRSGNAYVVGFTLSSNFPTTPGAFQTTPDGAYDAFVSKLNTAGSALVYSTYLGGRDADYGYGIAIDASGNAYVTGQASFGFPTTPGAFQTTFAGTSDAFVAKITFSNGPVVALKPSSVPFLLLRTVGTTSLPQTVKLTNAGSAELDITGITITGPDGGDFAQSKNCPAAVASGASCIITVTFTPKGQGVRTASVSITDTAPGGPQTIPLTGRGTFLQWSPRSMYMGDQPAGTSSAARTVTLTNVGAAPIAIFSITLAGVNPGDFSQTNDCGSRLNAGASCTIQVTFTPTALGGRIGHVAIRDNAFGGTHWVGLLGKGT